MAAVGGGHGGGRWQAGVDHLEAVADPGGGGGGGYHAPSFSTPRQSFSCARVRVLPRRSRVSARRVAPRRQRLDRRCRRMAGPTAKLCGRQPPGRRRAARSCQYAQLGQPPERRQSCEQRQSANMGTGPTSRTGRSIGNNQHQSDRTISPGRHMPIGTAAISTAATGTTAIGTATGTTLGILSAAGLVGGRLLGRRRPFRDSLVLGILSVLQPLLRRSDRRRRFNVRLLAADRGGSAGCLGARRVRPPSNRRRPCSMRRGLPSCRATTRPRWPRWIRPSR